MERSARKRVSSGIGRLDSLLGDLSIGDNVLWYEGEGGLCSAFCMQFIRASLAAPPGCHAGALRVDAAVVDGPDGPRLVLVAAGG